jgi:hypothetical protein
MDNNNKTSGGIGFCGLLTLLFIGLKLCGVIAWSWLWVLSPIWIPVALVIVIWIIALIASHWF